jgi:hypothetical protein
MMLTGWRTIIVSAIVMALGGITAADLLPILGEPWTGIVMIAIGAVMAIMRYITTTPIGKSEPE